MLGWLRGWSRFGAEAQRAGVAEDVALNVVALDGAAGQTVSEHAEEAEARGAWWARWLCAFLSWAVQPDHCGKVRRGEPMSERQMLAAALWINAAIVLMALGAGMAFWGAVAAAEALL